MAVQVVGRLFFQLVWYQFRYESWPTRNSLELYVPSSVEYGVFNGRIPYCMAECYIVMFGFASRDEYKANAIVEERREPAKPSKPSR
ncbi:unnamed protein product [Fusarium graminearum]|uniref:Chromosome 4, complete genome n=1 Tax=Gibberella zeae (strain ATCC MYA-4620 / CBS 123657 / FGSC 9075 / NRRL 31084 / PH-1) TaxID=229533 RepID=A0A098DPT5_GIBZE|nr:unnamed protein product [Fusarium graminearum]CZS73334.1 unnamed protein product [Fusarium graminearum]